VELLTGRSGLANLGVLLTVKPFVDPWIGTKTDGFWTHRTEQSEYPC
jgi:hypothetical protein